MLDWLLELCIEFDDDFFTCWSGHYGWKQDVLKNSQLSETFTIMKTLGFMGMIKGSIYSLKFRSKDFKHLKN